MIEDANGTGELSIAMQLVNWSRIGCDFENESSAYTFLRALRDDSDIFEISRNGDQLFINVHRSYGDDETLMIVPCNGVYNIYAKELTQ